MTGQPRIAVFYGKGRTFLDVLKAVRAQHPDARLCLIFPDAYPIAEAELAFASETLRIGNARYGLRDLAAFLDFTRRVRHARYDGFVILFDTPRQRILAALTGARKRLYCRFDGRVVPLQYTLSGVVADAAFRAVWGRLAYAGLWVLVRVTRAQR